MVIAKENERAKVTLSRTNLDIVRRLALESGRSVSEMIAVLVSEAINRRRLMASLEARRGRFVR